MIRHRFVTFRRQTEWRVEAVKVSHTSDAAFPDVQKAAASVYDGPWRIGASVENIDCGPPSANYTQTLPDHRAVNVTCFPVCWRDIRQKREKIMDRPPCSRLPAC